ncbi:MAG: serine/threonine-protein kinase, partial [Candidatus Xenobia bacterium]
IPRRGFPLQEALRILQPTFSAIGYAHQHGIVHNDLKPDNIMVTTDGKVRVMDFGIATGATYARLTRTTDVLGTPGYLAPEQMDGVRNEPRSDQYAVGVIVFEMLTGRAPFDEADPMLRIAMHCSKKPPKVSDVNPALSAAVSEAVDRMLKKTPEERYATMEEAWAALAQACDAPLK